MDESELLKRHFGDLARRAMYKGDAVFSDFLDPQQCVQAAWAAGEVGTPVGFFGGYDDAERRIAAFGELADDSMYWTQIVLIEAAWNGAYAKCSHRDILGSLMAMGVERECFGDILVDDENSRAFVFVVSNMADYICANWESAGKAHLKVRTVSITDIVLPPPKGREMRVTVQSPRLDSIIASVFNLSRGEAQQYVRSGRVRINYAECDHVDKALSDDDLVSVRGLGRFKMLRDTGRTKRDRLGVVVFKYETKA